MDKGSIEWIVLKTEEVDVHVTSCRQNLTLKGSFKRCVAIEQLGA